MRWWMQRIFPIQRRAMGLARPLISSFVDIPLPTEKVYDSVERLFAQLDTLHAMLVNPRLTSIRLVLNPEKMVILPRALIGLNATRAKLDEANANLAIYFEPARS